MELAVFLFLLIGLPLARPENRLTYLIIKKVLCWLGMLFLCYLIVAGGH